MHLRLDLVLAVALISGVTAAAAQAPSTDIFIVPVDGQQVDTPRRLTDRDGYDNQPQFLPGGRRLVYTSLRDGGTDILLHDLSSGETTPLVATAQSEYSPTPIPGRNAISIVRDYGDLEQQLWSFPLDGGAEKLLLPDINPVGYHAWVDDETLILFVLGEPATLRLARVGSGTGKIVAEAPGRALARVPDSAEMSFVDKSGDPWWLTAINTARGTMRRLIAMPEGREDYAWAPDGAAWTGDDSRLFRWHPGDDEWRPVADLQERGISGITRLAFSPDGRSLALVSDRVTDE